MNIRYIVQKAMATPLAHRHNAAKEALQQCLLVKLAQSGLLDDVAFTGGTALRILHGLPRYSEDLDFVATNPRITDSTGKWSHALLVAMRDIGISGVHVLPTSIRKVAALEQKRVATTRIAAADPAFQSFARDGMQVSFEIDLDPPKHIVCEPAQIQVSEQQAEVPALTLPSLMAGKLHILLTRMDREKGRDWYDYVWYRERNVLPNVPQLQSAIEQTVGSEPEAKYWMSYLRERNKVVNWGNVQNDVRSFLETPAEVQKLNAVHVSNITPFPDFMAIVAELDARGVEHPLLVKRNLVRADITQAMMEGNTDAVEASRRLDIYAAEMATKSFAMKKQPPNR